MKAPMPQLQLIAAERTSDDLSGRQLVVCDCIFALIAPILVMTVMAGCSPGSGSAPVRRGQSATSVENTSSFPLTPLRETLFLNTSPEVTYVGSDKCQVCHDDEFGSHMQTTHSRALGDIQPSAEPPDASFVHEVSGRAYRIYRRDNQLRHREFLPSAEDSEYVLADYAMHSVIGSGNHSRSYLIERDGFLFESPITWYASQQAWGMSPGYEDQPNQPGFARPIEFECLNCHSGGLVRGPARPGQLLVREQAVGCERCHGPGSLHVDRHTNGVSVSSDGDFTIVNPRRLDRSERDDLCAQCHLSSAAQVELRGREIADFRPGLRLADFRVDYQRDDPGNSMTVVGHGEQMRLSQCYLHSDTLTCITCHNPHDRLTSEHRVAYFRAKCLTCHTEKACGLEHSVRIQRSAEDDCATCHMPKSPTDIVHFAFTHHRIGIHDTEESQSERTTSNIPSLVPFSSVEHLPEIERQRCLGLAYVQLADDSDSPAASRAYDLRARMLFEQVRAEGLRDADVDVGLAWIHRQDGEMQRAIELAKSALAQRSARFSARRDALIVVSRAYFDRGEFQAAIPYLEQLGELRLDAEDLMLLSISRLQSRNPEGAFIAGKQAAELEPDRPDLQELLAELYRQAGEQELSTNHKHRAERLRNALPAITGARMNVQLGR